MITGFFTIVFCISYIENIFITNFSGTRLDSEASGQRISTAVIEKSRGSIVDRNLIPFTNRSVESLLVLEPLALRGKNDYIQKLSDVLDISAEKLKGQVAGTKAPIIIEARENKVDDAQKIKGNGVSVINKLKRYGEFPMLAHVLDTSIRPIRSGQQDLEKFYDNDLKVSADTL